MIPPDQEVSTNDNSTAETEVLLQGTQKILHLKLGQTENAACIFVSEAEYYQIPEFGSSCRNTDTRLVNRMEDVMVGVTSQGRRVGGDVRKCWAGIKCKMIQGGRYYLCINIFQL